MGTLLHTRIDIALRDSRGRPLDDIVTEARAAGVGWRTITARIRQATGLDVSHETLRAWYPEDRAQGQQTPSR